MKLYCLKYNNYYNRIVKQEQTLADYLSKDANYTVINNVSFNPSDGVNTTQVINTSVNGDYAIIAKDDNTIISRWFIIEARRERTGQYTLTLHRDLIVDNYEKVINSPCFIEKATLEADDSAIYNKENMTFNQIKIDEHMLQDETECPWLVLYVAKNFTGLSNNDSVIDNNNTVDYYGSANSLEDWAFYRYIGTAPQVGNIQYVRYILTFNAGSMVIGTDGTVRPRSLSGTFRNLNASEIATLKNLTLSYFNGLTDTRANELLGWNNKTLRILSPISYKNINVYSGTPIQNVNNAIDNTSELYTFFDTLKATLGVSDTNHLTHVNGWLTASTYRAQATDIEVATYRYNLSNTVMNSKRITTDAPYNVWCLPYGEVSILYGEDDNGFTTKKEVSMLAVQQLLKDMETYIYDAQLLPYCPLVNSIGRTEVYVDKITTDSVQCATIVNGTSYEKGTPVSAILFADKASFTTNIPYTMAIHRPIKRPSIPTIRYENSLAYDIKAENELYRYRLCSPNYNGIFEFSVAMNNGVDYFNVDCTYKPYSPYIHVNPNFKGLYYKDFNDTRGLICGGDFSISHLSDAFKQYEINHKNYVTIFDREIQNLEVQQKYQLIEQGIGALTSATTTGLGLGIFSGSATLGKNVGMGSALAGLADLEITSQLQHEALDYKKDMFGYQMGNIKALPYSLSKVDAFNENNKIFPFIEKYSATNEEFIAFKNKIKYNGMTVGRIGTIAEFIKDDGEKHYIKGQLIRNEDIVEDFNYLNALSEEIYKGAFY